MSCTRSTAKTYKVLIERHLPSVTSMASIALALQTQKAQKAQKVLAFLELVQVAAGLALYCDLGQCVVAFFQRERPESKTSIRSSGLTCTTLLELRRPVAEVLQPLQLHCSWYRTLGLLDVWN